MWEYVRPNADVLKDKETYYPNNADPDYEKLTAVFFKNNAEVVELFKWILQPDSKAQKADKVEAKRLQKVFRKMLNTLKHEYNKEEKRKSRTWHDLPPSQHRFRKRQHDEQPSTSSAQD